MTQLGFEATFGETRNIVHEYVVTNSLETPVTNGKPGYNWCSDFFKRHHLSVKKSGLMQIARKTVTSDPFVIYELYELLTGEVERLGLADRPQCFRHCDESGFSMENGWSSWSKTVRVTFVV